MQWCKIFIKQESTDYGEKHDCLNIAKKHSNAGKFARFTKTSSEKKTHFTLMYKQGKSNEPSNV